MAEGASVTVVAEEVAEEEAEVALVGAEVASVEAEVVVEASEAVEEEEEETEDEVAGSSLVAPGVVVGEVKEETSQGRM